MDSDNVIKIPVSATYRIIDGKPVMLSADYREIPAEVVARFLLERFNVPMEQGA